MTAEKYKLFKRYLKERGLYANFMNEAKRFPERRRGLTIKHYLLEMSHPTAGIMDLLAWQQCSWNGWSDEYIRYKNIMRKIEEGENVYEIFKRIKKISVQKN